MNLLTQQVGQHLSAHYKAVQNILQSQESYTQAVKINNVTKYFAFVNSALEKDYGRIIHVYLFLNADTVMSDRMYPFCYLKESAITEVYSIYARSEWLMNGLRDMVPKGAYQLEWEEWVE